MMKKKRDKFFTKCLIVGILLYAVYFNERVFDLLEQGFSEPMTLIATVLGLLFGQLWNMATIEKTKTKMKGDCKDENQLGSETEQP